MADRQAQSLQALARQVTKVQLKTRLAGHDTKPLLRKVRAHCCAMSIKTVHGFSCNIVQCLIKQIVTASFCGLFQCWPALLCTMVQMHAELFSSASELLISLFVDAQVQQENLQQAEVLAAHAAQIEAVNKDLQDTQKLLSALQSTASRPCMTVISVQDTTVLNHVPLATVLR